MEKKEEQEFTGADLKFRHFDLAKRLSVNMLQEMIQARLPKEEIPQVLNDMCKFVVLSEANVSKENGSVRCSAFCRTDNRPNLPDDAHRAESDYGRFQITKPSNHNNHEYHYQWKNLE